MKKLTYRIYSLFIVLAILSTSVSVNATTFSDESLWQAEAGAFALENFDNLGHLGTSVNELPNLGVTFNNSECIYDGSSGGPLASPPYSLINTYPYNSSSLSPISFSSKSPNSLISAVGLWNASGDDELYLRFYDNSGILIESMIIGANQDTPIFGGIVNKIGAARVEIEGTGNSNMWVAIDNLQVTLTPVSDLNGLVAYYPFNGNANDESGNGNHGTVNGATLTADRMGNTDSAFSFDGVDDYISIPDSDLIDFDYNENFTIALWIKVASVQPDQGNGDNDIVEKWSGWTPYSYVIRYANQSGKVYVARHSRPHTFAITSSNSLNDLQFHHVAFVKNGKNLYLFIDGLQNGTTIDNSITTKNNSPLYLGKRGNNINYFKGVIDDLRLYKRALSPSEIQDLTGVPLSGCFKSYGKPITSDTVMMIQTGEYHQKTQLDINGCFKLNRLNQDKTYTIIIRKKE